MKDKIETDVYRIAPGRYVRQTMMMWLSRWWWVILTPIIIFAIMGIYDIRWYIVCLALLLVLYPGVMLIIYFNHALRPEAALCVIPHRVTISEEGIYIVYEPSEEYRTPKPQHISLDSITETEDTGDAIQLHLGNSRYRWIEIPNEAFKPHDITYALKILQKKSYI